MEKKKKGHPSVVLNTTDRLHFDLHHKVTRLSKCHLLARRQTLYHKTMLQKQACKICKRKMEKN